MRDTPPLAADDDLQPSVSIRRIPFDQQASRRKLGYTKGEGTFQRNGRRQQLFADVIGADGSSNDHCLIVQRPRGRDEQLMAGEGPMTWRQEKPALVTIATIHSTQGGKRPFDYSGNMFLNNVEVNGADGDAMSQ